MDELGRKCAQRQVLYDEEARLQREGETEENREALQRVRADLGQVLKDIARLSGE